MNCLPYCGWTPTALHPERLAHLGAEKCAHDGEQVAGAAAGVHSRDRVPVLLVGVRDALEHALDNRQLHLPVLRLIGHDPKVPVTTDSRGAVADSDGLDGVEHGDQLGRAGEDVAARLALDRLDESGTGSSVEAGTTQQRPKGTYDS